MASNQREPRPQPMGSGLVGREVVKTYCEIY
jgi:hypothetical protein